jgi:lincosamide nucleotidyltransferase A/C/D/E
VGGGWGVDVLAGRQTRRHRDLDLAVDADDEARALETLAVLGYQVETDWRPTRVELVAAGRGWVDLHPVVFDEAGNGQQFALDGGHFSYPADAFTHASLADVTIQCLSVRQQLLFHKGYQPRDVDLQDIAVLHSLSQDRS